MIHLSKFIYNFRKHESPIHFLNYLLLLINYFIYINLWIYWALVLGSLMPLPIPYSVEEVAWLIKRSSSLSFASLLPQILSSCIFNIIWSITLSSSSPKILGLTPVDVNERVRAIIIWAIYWTISRFRFLCFLNSQNESINNSIAFFELFSCIFLLSLYEMHIFMYSIIWLKVTERF